MSCLLTLKKPRIRKNKKTGKFEKWKDSGEHTIIWTAVDRNKSKIIDFEIGDRSFTAYLPLAIRLTEKYNVKTMCSDDYAVYKQYNIADKHICSKSESCLVESFNAFLRRRLASLVRRSFRVHKSILRNALFLLINEKKWLDMYI